MWELVAAWSSVAVVEVEPVRSGWFGGVCKGTANRASNRLARSMSEKGLRLVQTGR